MKTNLHLTFSSIVIDDILLIQALARKIWQESYAEMISAAQIGYLLGLLNAEQARQVNTAHTRKTNIRKYNVQRDHRNFPAEGAILLLRPVSVII